MIKTKYTSKVCLTEVHFFLSSAYLKKWGNEEIWLRKYKENNGKGNMINKEIVDELSKIKTKNG